MKAITSAAIAAIALQLQAPVKHCWVFMCLHMSSELQQRTVMHVNEQHFSTNLRIIVTAHAKQGCHMVAFAQMILGMVSVSQSDCDHHRPTDERVYSHCTRIADALGSAMCVLQGVHWRVRLEKRLSHISVL